MNDFFSLAVSKNANFSEYAIGACPVGGINRFQLKKRLRFDNLRQLLERYFRDVSKFDLVRLRPDFRHTGIIILTTLALKHYLVVGTISSTTPVVNDLHRYFLNLASFFQLQCGDISGTVRDISKHGG